MTIAAIKRQIPFLIGGTVTGIVMSYYLGFLVTILVNSIGWYLISVLVYKVVTCFSYTGKGISGKYQMKV